MGTWVRGPVALGSVEADGAVLSCGEGGQQLKLQGNGQYTLSTTGERSGEPGCSGVVVEVSNEAAGSWVLADTHDAGLPTLLLQRTESTIVQDDGVDRLEYRDRTTEEASLAIDHGVQDGTAWLWVSTHGVFEAGP